MRQLKHQDLLLCSFRYALGRRTAMVSTVVEYLIEDWGWLKPWAQLKVQREIEEAFERGGGGDRCDVVEWQRILDLEVGSGD